MSKNPIRISNEEPWLVAFDCDGTLTTSAYRSSWHVVHKYFDTWETIGEPALRRFVEGKITYQDFCLIDAGAWVNRHEEEFQAALNNIELRPGVEKMLSFFQQHGCILVIISMGLSDIVERIANKYNFDFWIANEIVRRNQRITGEVIINVAFQKKGAILEQLLRQYNISQTNSIAFGDTSSDTSLFKVAGTAIAIQPSSSNLADMADFVYHDNDLSNLVEFFFRFD